MKPVTVLLLLGMALVTCWLFRNNAQVEQRRRKMRSLHKGMSRVEIEARLTAPEAISNCSSKPNGAQDSCVVLHYTSPAMDVKLFNGYATTACFYEGKSETIIFE